MRKRLLIALAGCFFLSILIFFTRNSRPSLFIQGIFQSIYEAPKSLLYELAVKTNEKSEIVLLRKENSHLRSKLAVVQQMQKDNVALRSQFEEGIVDSNSLLLSDVIGFQGGVLNPEMLIVNKGIRDQVQKGQPVIIENNIIGVVHSAGEKYSSITLVTNSQFTTVAKTEPNDVLGVVQGTKDALIMDRVAITDTLEKGSTVLTRGSIDKDGRGVPPNLIIGVIESVRRVESEPFQSAQIKSLVDIPHLTKVFIKI
jgi:rod shape-determining protein MreC